MIYDVKYFSPEGYRNQSYIECDDFECLSRFINRNKERFCEITEIKIKVHGFVERIDYTKSIKSV